MNSLLNRADIICS